MFFNLLQEPRGLKDTNCYESFLIYCNYNHHGSPRGFYRGSVLNTDIDMHNSEKSVVFSMNGLIKNRSSEYFLSFLQ